jgi:hypothetical protein
MLVSDPFWYNNISILFKSDRLTEFFPTEDQTLEERLNSLVRLSLYSSVILFYYHKNYKYLYIFLAALLMTYYIYSQKENSSTSSSSNAVEKHAIENLTNEPDLIDNASPKCTPPSLDNPFMNVTMKDMLNIDPNTNTIIDRPKACDTSDPKIKQDMDNMFNNNLFKDVNDVFGKMNSQRQFYTMPNTSIPNAQDDFAKWLYLNPKTCKEDQEFCLKYEDIRAKRPVFVDPTQNPTRKDQ